MIGPSSSHTAGAAKIGYFTHFFINNVSCFDITFYGSFAKTYQGHFTSNAVVGGLLGYKPDNKKIKTSLEDVKKLGYKINFIASLKTPPHPNCVKISWKENNISHYVLGISVGGGQIKILEFDQQILNISEIENYSIILTNYDLNLNSSFLYLKNRTEKIYLVENKDIKNIKNSNYEIKKI